MREWVLWGGSLAERVHLSSAHLRYFILNVCKGDDGQLLYIQDTKNTIF